MKISMRIFKRKITFPKGVNLFHFQTAILRAGKAEVWVPDQPAGGPVQPPVLKQQQQKPQLPRWPCVLPGDGGEAADTGLSPPQMLRSLQLCRRAPHSSACELLLPWSFSRTVSSGKGWLEPVSAEAGGCWPKGSAPEVRERGASKMALLKAFKQFFETFKM